jgi:hypothetical protein
MYKTLYISLLFCFMSKIVFAQSPTRPVLAAKKIAENMKLDGILNEPAWAEAAEATNFTEFERQSK